jgi:hypothetical protein
MDDLQGERGPLDPLERVWRGRAVVLVAGLTVLLVLAVSASGGTPKTLPGIALGSPALLHIERALLVGASIAGCFIFLIRGWAGYFPSKLSTGGAEYPHRPVDEVVESGDAIYDEIDGLKKVHKALAGSTHARLDGCEREIATLRAQVIDGRRADDML